MRAVVVEEFGDPGRLAVRELPDLEPGAGQVRLRVAGAGINPVDTYNVKDPSWARLDPGCVLGYDVAGTIEAVGDGVTDSFVGRRVMAMTPFPRGQGGYAERVVIDVSLVGMLPDHADLVAAASVPLAAGTAWEVLAKLDDPGSSMLVIGGSGGVGLFLLQLASAQGIRVVATGREERHQQMRDCGAVACIDYRRPDAIAEAAKAAGGGFDSIADLIGGPLAAEAQQFLRHDGAIAAIAASEVSIDALIDANQSVHGILIRDDGERVQRLAAMFGDGLLRAHVGAVLPFEQASEAHRLVDSGKAAGKVVLTP
jgi:NADPH2:quinone reductase